MDPIFDRLGRLFRSNNPFSSSSGGAPLDDDERAAMEELEAELNAPPGAPPRRPTQGQRTYQEQRRQESAHREPPPLRPALDPAVAKAYAVLGLVPSASWEEINASHRSLLKKYHPDRHAGNEAMMKQATAQSQKINEAFQVLKKHLGR